MMLSITLVLLIAGWVTAEFDIEIQKKYEELPFNEFVTYFNGLNLTWTIKEYSEQDLIFGVREGFMKSKSYRKVHHEPMDLPENFDSREKWPHCDSIRTINYQGRCGSCWVFGSINTASDRTCIHKNINVQLSEAEGSCMINGSICAGGFPDDGFNFWIKKGLVTKQCVNYTVENAMDGKCKTECDNPHIKYNDDKHFGENIYQVDRDSIREELVKNGPVEASMVVFNDFFNYTGGIYEHKYGKFLGMHSVRVVGYGTEGGVDYWLIANSWGAMWGEKGFFRIKRFIDMYVEDTVLTGLPKN